MAGDRFLQRWSADGNMREAIRAEAGWRRRLGLMRALFPAAAAGVAVAVVAWPMVNGADHRVDVVLGADGIEIGDRDEAVRPRFESTDSSERPYTVNAALAWRPQTGAGRVFLEGPEADLTASDGGRMTVAAERGILDRDRETLHLSGGVDVWTESGLELRTEAARFDLRTGRATTEDRVRGRGRWGEIDAVGCVFLAGPGDLRCGGRPSAVLHPDEFEGGG